MDEKNLLPNDVEISEIVLNKKNHALELIHQKELNKMNNYKTNKFIKTQVAAIAGICVLGLGSAGVIAAINHNWGRGMSGNLQATDTQKQQLTDEGLAIVYPEEVNYADLKVTQNGIEVAPHTVIVDDRFAYISFSISGYSIEDGEEPCFEFTDVTADGESFNTFASMYGGIVSDEECKPVYEDGSPIAYRDDGSIIEKYTDENGNMEYFIQAQTVDIEDSMLGKTLNIELQNLGTMGKAEFFDDIDGTWSFELKLPEISSAKDFTVNKLVEGTDFTLTDVNISPVSMRLNYQISKKPETSNDKIAIPRIQGVILKDGTRIPYLADGGSYGFTDDTHAVSISGYDRVINVDDVKALIIIREDTYTTVEVEIQ